MFVPIIAAITKRQSFFEFGTIINRSLTLTWDNWQVKQDSIIIAFFTPVSGLV